MKRLTCVLVIASFTSCATIVHRDMEPISVVTDPVGAEVTARCSNVASDHGVTPARLFIPRTGVGCVVELSRAGYRSRTIPLERGYNAAFWSNFAPASGLPVGLATAFGGYHGAGGLAALGVAGALGFAVDRITGRGFGHEPDSVVVTLERAN